MVLSFTCISNYVLQVTLHSIETLSDVHACLNSSLSHYNEEFGNEKLDIMLSDFAISHIVRIHRILSFSYRLLVGIFVLHYSVSVSCSSNKIVVLLSLNEAMH